MKKKKPGVETENKREEFHHFIDYWATSGMEMTGSRKIFMVLAIEDMKIRMTYLGTIPPFSSPEDVFTPFDKQEKGVGTEYLG